MINSRKPQKSKQKPSNIAILYIILSICAVAVVGLAIALIVSSLNQQSIPKERQETPGNSRIIPSVDKPVIYLYPESEQKVTVELGYPDRLTTSYPSYETGWNVLAQPDGNLTDLSTGRSLYALYYESKYVGFSRSDEGFVVRGEDTAQFLEDKLTILGLNAREAEEFIIYWLPKLEPNPYNYIRFATSQEIADVMPLKITPSPDNLIRVLMLYEGLSEPVQVKAQQLSSPKRDGFTVVEWGGTRISNEPVQ